VITSFARDNERLHDELIKIRYWARGGITREEMWCLTPSEREAEIQFLNKRFEEVTKSLKNGGTPFF
jgi:hypothetical protein